MADQRELHDIEQVVPAIFEADIADAIPDLGPVPSHRILVLSARHF
jgi:hypothetical protein